MTGEHTNSLRWKTQLQAPTCGLKVKMDPKHLYPKSSSVENIEEIEQEETAAAAADTSLEKEAPGNVRDATFKKVSFYELPPVAAKPQNMKSSMLRSTPSKKNQRPPEEIPPSKSFKSGIRSRKHVDKSTDVADKTGSNSQLMTGTMKDEIRSQTSKGYEKRQDEMLKGVYEGAYVNGKKCGEGKESFPNGCVYEGNWKNDRMHGKGRMTKPNGDWHEGNWKDGHEHGKGTKFDANTNCTTTGTWVYGNLEGHASEEWEDGAKFEGNFHNNLKNGPGKLEFKDGSYYEGNFLNNEIHGEGRYYWPNNRTYIGQWSHNQMSGHGQLVYTNGCTYTGEFEMNQKHGEGEFVWQDGKKYIGSWFRGKQHGHGKIITAKGEEKIGEWCQGKRVHEGSSHKSP